MTKAKIYFVKHDNLYSVTEDGNKWAPNRDLNQVAFFTVRQRAFDYAKTIKAGPRRFAGLGSRARVVSLKIPVSA